VQLAEDMGCWVEEREFCAVVWSDRIGTHFQLRPQPA
jgi:hypothetical protein